MTPHLVTDLSMQSNLPSNQSSFDIKSILDNGFTWYCPTPKHRTSAEKKYPRKASLIFRIVLLL